MWTNGTVVKRIEWNDKLFSLQITADISPFIAGQFIKLSQIINGKRIARAYSLVNSPSDPFLEVLAITIQDGKLSPNLHLLSVGDEIEVSTKASGFMTLDEVPNNIGKHLWLFATGTAVGPFISILRNNQVWQRFEKIILVYGVRFGNDLAYLAFCQQLQQADPDKFIFIPCVTREQHKNAIYSRIPQAISSGEIEKIAGIKISTENSQVMICGNPKMVSDVQALLLGKGLTKNLRREAGNITIEKYW